MSIRARIDDALILWERGRYEGALLNALVAFAATARRKYPDRKTINDNQSFESLFTDAKCPIHKVEFRGELHPLGRIFYKWLRCELVHEGEIPNDINLIMDEMPGRMSLRAGGPPHYTLILSTGWFGFFVDTVMNE